MTSSSKSPSPSTTSSQSPTKYGPSEIMKIWRELIYMDILHKCGLRQVEMDIEMREECRRSIEKRIEDARRTK